MNTLSFKKLLFFGLVLSVVLTSCTSDEMFSGEETFGIRHDRSLAEYEKIAANVSPYNTEDYPDFSSVIQFSYSLNGTNAEDYQATGTLVAPNWILTAGHNFYVAEEQSNPAPASGVKVNFGNDPNNPNRTIEVVEIVYQPSWIEHNKDFENANDMALVRLKDSVTTITPAVINFDEVENIGGQVWLAGYGDYSQQKGQDQDKLSKKHAIENILDRVNKGIKVSTNGVEYEGGLLAFDFDSPLKDINTLGDDVVNPDERLLGEGSSDIAPLNFEGATVSGDSGCPLFMKIDGQWKIIGVLSGGAQDPVENLPDADYGDISIFIRTAMQKDWIQSVIK